MVNQYGIIYYTNFGEVKEHVLFKETEEEVKELAKDLIDTQKTFLVKWFKVCGVVKAEATVKTFN